MHVCIHERLCLCICFLLYYGKPLLFLAPSKLPWSPPRAEPEQSQSKARAKPEQSQRKARAKQTQSHRKAIAKPGRSQGKARAKPGQPGFGKPEQPGFGLLPTQASLPTRVPPLQKLYKHLVFALVAKGDSCTCFGGGVGVFQAQAPPPMMRVRKRPASLTHPDAFPYVVLGNKYESARAFLSESPIQALRDMCFYLGMIPCNCV